MCVCPVHKDDTYLYIYATIITYIIIIKKSILLFKH